jgi:hypothetical protein
MLRLTDARCDRREFLRIGGLALGGLTLPRLLAARADSPGLPERSVVLLFLQGGPSQIETFDPKMTAPEEVRSITGEVPTALPGVTFGATFPKLAALADRLAVVRSFASGNADHQNYVSVAGGNALKAPMGTLVARLGGPNHPRTGLPRNIAVTPEAVSPGLKLQKNFETDSLQKLLAAGAVLGPGYAPFELSGNSELRKSLELGIPRERFDDRRALLERLDGLQRSLAASGDLDRAAAFERQAADVILRGVGDAFDLKKEDPQTLAKYDTSGLFRMEELNRWGDMRRSTNLLGKQMLLARRLCEAGAGFVTVFDAGWDMHANNNSPKNMEGLQQLGRQVDHAVAAFVEDVRQRGLEDRILLLVTGEMGRTPKRNKNGGRDHWANLTPLLIAGGGLKMGQVIGQSDRQAGTPAADPYRPENLLATVLHFLFDLGRLRLRTDLGRELKAVVDNHKPIEALF